MVDSIRAWQQSPPMGLAALESSVRGRPFRDFECLEITPRPSKEILAKRVRGIADKSFSIAEGKIDSLRPPIQWSDHPRSFEFHLHAFMPLKTLLMAHSEFRSREQLDVIFAFVGDWIEQNAASLDLSDIPAAVSACLEDPHPSRWYDMAIGQRLQVLAYVLDAALREDDVDAAFKEKLRDQILLHHALLREDKVYRSKNNHGFYQAITQYAAATRLPELSSDGFFVELSKRRLMTMIASQFGSDHVHREHSPGYHFLLTVTLTNALRCDMFDEGLAELVEKFQAVLANMFKPDGRIVTIGDTDPRKIAGDVNLDGFFTDPHLINIVSGGAQGLAPPAAVVAYPETGFVFMRLDGQPQAGGFEARAYLAQTAAFHSRIHKHADHLSFVWHDQGRDILIDPGRYAYSDKTERGSKLFEQGFWYSDERRIYVEKTRAHNALEIDGADYRRVRAKPFGSGLLFADEIDGAGVSLCQIVHDRAITHRRLVVMLPGRALLVLDWAYDRKKSHDYRQWFQFDNQWYLTGMPSGMMAVATHDKNAAEAKLQMFSLIDEAVIRGSTRGQSEPHLQGWMSDAASSLVPATSVCVETLDCKMARFATLFTLGEDAVVDRRRTRFNASMRKGVAVWCDMSGEIVLDIEVKDDDSVALTWQ